MELRKYKLCEICKIYGRIGFRGYTTKDLVEKEDDGAITLSPTNIIDGELDYSNNTYLNWNKYYESPEIIIEENNIVLVKTGSSLGKTALVRKLFHPTTLNPQFVVLKDIKANPVYFSYLLKSDYFQKNISAIKTGSAIPTLSQEDLGSIKLFLPNREIQDKIAAVLSALDDKIALNRRMNAKLEQMAKRLYDHWFVQFDFPNADGKPYKASGGKMVWNEVLKREIPEGWEVKKLDEVLDCNKSSMTSNSDYGYIRYLDTSSLTENKIRELMKIDNIKQYPSRAKRIIQKNDILYSTVRPAQHHFGIIKNPVENMIASTGFAVLSCKMGSEYNEIFYQFITSTENIQKLDAIANLNASSYPSINPSDILDLKIALPTDISELKPFIEKFAKIYTMIELNQKEIQKLTALRDSLLPLLMNGQVEVE